MHGGISVEVDGSKDVTLLDTVTTVAGGIMVGE